MNDIENGMIVGEEWWDPQQRTQRTLRCVCCKEGCAVEELTRFQSGDLVCALFNTVVQGLSPAKKQVILFSLSVKSQHENIKEKSIENL